MFNLYKPIRKSIRAKILISLTISVAIVMGIVIALGVVKQRQQLRKQMTIFGADLKSVIYASIKHPMSTGDSATVKQQLIEIRDLMHQDEILICDFDQEIIFATHSERIGTFMDHFTSSSEMLHALESLIRSGEKPSIDYFEEKTDGHRYLLTVHGMPNEPECYHCHGSSRKVLGCLITRHETDQTYAAIATLRNETIAISVFGIGAVVLLAYFLLSRLVTQPVVELAEQAEHIAHSDFDVQVEVKSEDAIGMLGATFNIMAKNVKDQIEYFNSLRDAIAAPLFIVNTDKVITFMNEACERLVGYKKEEVEGKLTCREIFHSNRCETNCPLRYCLEEGMVVDGITAIIKDRDGSEIPIMTSASALKDGYGNIIGAVEICKDITDVLEAERLRFIQVTADKEEKQRRYLEKRVRGLLGVLSKVSGGDLKVRAEILNSSEVMDQISKHINLTLDEFEKLYAKISSFNKELELEVDRRTKMLREKTVLLERANRELRELDKLKSAFLANMSHELRTPMNSIIGYTDLLLDGIDGEINEEQQKSLGKVQHNAQHLLQLINDILDMAKIESGKIELSPQMTDIQELTESIATIFEPTIKKKGLTLQLDFAEHLPPVYVDEDKVRQIFINLLSNAVKFTEKGGVRITIRPADGDDSSSFVQVCVEDSGIGIKAEDMDKLYDKFSQIDVSSVRQYEGTGLGLSIARGLVVMHKGKIWAESDFGKGSRFFFTLPSRKELMQKQENVAIETELAGEFAQRFATESEVFLQDATYGGKPLKCWEFAHCGQISCPAYNNKELRCWLIPGTHCQGEKIVAGPEKVDVCKGCEIIEHLQLAERGGANGGLRAVERNKSPVSTVLVIDDNPDVIDLVQKYIGNQYEVVGLLSGHDAVARAAVIQPIAITLDIMMPGKDGWQVLYELKQDPATQDIPVIILSIIDNKKLGFSLGAAEYIVKPINKDLLLHKLRSFEKIAAIGKILVVDNSERTVRNICTLLQDNYQTYGAQSCEEAIGKIEESIPDLIVINPIMPMENGIDLLEYIKTDPKTQNIPLILITQKDFSKEEFEDLNGRIQVILNKGILSEEDLLRQLAETIKKCQPV